MASDADAARKLMSARAVRSRARKMLGLCAADALAHWRLDRTKLPEIADLTIAIMRENYPDLNIPFHARWRHFSTGGKERWPETVQRANWPDAASRARAEFDLAIVSVLLDAGAGAQWRFHERDGAMSARSEGLAIASLEMFAAGFFSGDAQDPLRADAARLATLTERDLAAGFQVGETNPLVGLSGRTKLLNALGRACLASPDVFARNDAGRPGGLLDVLFAPRIEAEDILAAVLAHLGPVWPSRLTLGGVALGDCWRHPQIRAHDVTDGFVPFHKLSQWLSYSLIEPLQQAGAHVVEIDGLTGLPEYRNGGLFVDFGALVAKNPDDLRQPQAIASAFIVEWRALTVALLDEIADMIRMKLKVSREELPLGRVLEGGTWAAGRRIAAMKRADGAPPLNIVSDGTVF